MMLIIFLISLLDLISLRDSDQIMKVNYTLVASSFFLSLFLGFVLLSKTTCSFFLFFYISSLAFSPYIRIFLDSRKNNFQFIELEGFLFSISLNTGVRVRTFGCFRGQSWRVSPVSSISK
jgi:hypothetical protein